ncbi:MAG: hypothetical protein ACKVP4_05860 [Hyphomicrobium sp.]
MSRFVIAMSALLAVSFAAPAGAVDPPVPPGRDPGGRAVALIGRGLDYTLTHIAQRLARDGEGEIFGYDLIDQDRSPFAPSDQPSDMGVAEVILGEGQATTLAPLRADISSWSSIGQGIALASAMSAAIIVILSPPNVDKLPELLRSASKRYPSKLFIVAAGDDGQDLDSMSSAHDDDMPNVLVVTATAEPANSGAKSIDLAAPVDGGAGTSEIAAGRIAALAARLLAVEPDLTAADTKARILALAEPWREGAPRRARAGWISAPRRHFWLE